METNFTDEQHANHKQEFSLASRIDKYRAVLVSIIEGSALCEDVFMVRKLTDEADISIARELVPELSQAFSVAAGEIRNPGIHRYKHAFCSSLAEELKSNELTREDFEYFFSIASCDLIPAFILNFSLPVDMLINYDFRGQFGDSEDFWLVELLWQQLIFYNREDDITLYLRNSLKKDLVNVDGLTYKMLVKISGVKI